MHGTEAWEGNKYEQGWKPKNRICFPQLLTTHRYLFSSDFILIANEYLFLKIFCGTRDGIQGFMQTLKTELPSLLPDTHLNYVACAGLESELSPSLLSVGL